MKVIARVQGDVSLRIRAFKKDFPIYNGFLDKAETIDMSLHGYSTSFPIVGGFNGAISVDADKGVLTLSLMTGGVTLFSYPIGVGDLSIGKTISTALPSINAQSGFWKGIKIVNGKLDLTLA